MCKVLRKTNICYPLIRTSTCGYQEARNTSFSKIFPYALNGWSPISLQRSIKSLSSLNRTCSSIVIMIKRCARYLSSLKKDSLHFRCAVKCCTERPFRSLYNICDALKNFFYNIPMDQTFFLLVTNPFLLVRAQRIRSFFWSVFFPLWSEYSVNTRIQFG